MPETCTILVAEDNQDDLIFLKQAFAGARLKHTLQFVADGEQAAAYLLGSPPFNDRLAHPLPDLVMLDASLRPRNGFEILQLMKAASFLKHIPVCIMSRVRSGSDQGRAASLGACCYHVKRRSREAWDQIVREVCGQCLDKCADGDQK